MVITVVEEETNKSKEAVGATRAEKIEVWVRNFFVVPSEFSMLGRLSVFTSLHFFQVR